jgi:hypothetical protein
MWPNPSAIEAWVDQVRERGLATELDGALLASTQAWVDRIAPPRA